MTDMSELKCLLESQGTAIEEFKKHHETRLDDMEIRFNRGSLMGKEPHSPPLVKSQTGKEYRVLSNSDRLAAREHEDNEDGEFSIAAFVKTQLRGSSKPEERKYMGSPYMVPTAMSDMIIDDIRAQTVIIQAGAQTIIIDGPTTIPRIDADPTVYQHTEGSEDIAESDGSVSSVEVNPKTLVALVPVTYELVEDSPVFEAMIRKSFAGAFAQKLDNLVLAKLVADAGIPESSAGQDPADWSKVMLAIGEAMSADQRVPAAMISNAADYVARVAQLASTSGNWLGRPPTLKDMLDLSTSNVATGTSFFGDFNLGLKVAIREDIQFEVIRWQKAKQAIHLLVAHARMDGYIAQPKAMFRQLASV